MRSEEQELRNEQGSCRKLYHGIRWFLSFKLLQQSRLHFREQLAAVAWAERTMYLRLVEDDREPIEQHVAFVGADRLLCRAGLRRGNRSDDPLKCWTDILWVDDPQVASSDNPVPFVRRQSSARPVPEIHARRCGTSRQRQSDNADQRLLATRAPAIPPPGTGHGTGADNPTWSRRLHNRNGGRYIRRTR